MTLFSLNNKQVLGNLYKEMVEALEKNNEA